MIWHSSDQDPSIEGSPTQNKWKMENQTINNNFLFTGSGSQTKLRQACILTHGWRGRDASFSELILPCFYAKRSRSPAPRWWWCHGLGKLIVFGIIFRKATNWTWQRKTVVSSKNLKYVRFSNKNSLEEFTIKWKFTLHKIFVELRWRTETLVATFKGLGVRGNDRI